MSTITLGGQTATHEFQARYLRRVYLPGLFADSPLLPSVIEGELTCFTFNGERNDSLLPGIEEILNPLR